MFLLIFYKYFDPFRVDYQFKNANNNLPNTCGLVANKFDSKLLVGDNINKGEGKPKLAKIFSS